MEICGHQIFPELVEKEKPRKKSRDPLGDMMRDLRKQKRQETAARVAAERERQQKEAEFHLSDTEDYFPNDIRDARVSGHTSCKLLELPPDVLNLIVDHSVPHNQSLVGGLQTYTAALRHLRLIHPCFAYLRLLLNRLFGNLTLRADPDQLRELENGIGRIAPFVKKITFCSTKVRRVDLAQRKRRDSSHEIRRVLGRRIDKVIEDGRLLSTWSGVLQQCPNLRDFAVTRRLVDEDNIDLGPSADVLMGVVVKSIIAANKKPLGISIDHTTDNDNIGTTLPEWKDLDFRELRELDLSLTMQRIPTKYNYWAAFRREAKLLLSYILKTSSRSLERLATSGHTLKALVGMDMPELPALRKLHLDGSNHFIDPVRLGRLITHLSGLKKLRLEKLYTKPHHQIQYWQPIFGAVRHHTNDIWVDFADLHTDSALGPRWKLNATFQLPQPVCNVTESDSIAEAIEKMIKNYLSKHGDWYLLNTWNPALYQESEQSDSESFAGDWQDD